MNKLNPFSNNRAEYMKDLWRYYVPNNQIDFTTCQPLYIEGGRGTGKTTLFLCNCWREKYNQDKELGGNGLGEILGDRMIGLYYKVDPAFVTAMEGNGREKDFWNGIFCTYLSLEIIKELFSLLLRVEECGKITKDDVRRVSRRYYNSVRGEEAISVEIEELLSDCENALDEIENVMNSESGELEKVRKTSAGTIVNQVIEQVSRINIFSEMVFKIYIDEYEAMEEWQQRIVNSLIKRSNNKVVYNVGVKPKGMKTFDTLADGENLQKTHDYQYFCLDAIIADGYEQMLKDICKRRLELFKEKNKKEVGEISTDIEDYLGKYSFEEELKRYESKKKPQFYKDLEMLLRQECSDEGIIERLCIKATPFHARLHMAILLRNKKYKPSAEKLDTCYCSWIGEKNTKEKECYREWVHNAQNGVMFLLAKDYHVRKWYYGFDTYVQLSSGVVRFFLELCEQVFNIAIQNGFQWGEKAKIIPEIQTRAASYVSKKQIMEIESYAECGKQLMIFTQFLGSLFRELHRNDNLTLGEPEPNHFSVNLMELDAETKRSLESAIRRSVLQELPQTKEKEMLHTSAVDYHLNKIFAPYFEISCYRKRKLDLECSFIDALLSTKKEIAEKAVKEYLRKYWKNKKKIDSSEERELLEYTQLSFFD